MGFGAGIWVLRLGFGPEGWDFGLKARIWASRLGFGPQGWDLGLEEFGAKGEEEKEKISHTCENTLRAAAQQQQQQNKFSPPSSPSPP